MRILIFSPAFSPRVGGLEAVMLMLANGFSARGHQVVVISTTPDNTGQRFPFEVVRNPSTHEFVGRLRWCDVYLQGNVSLKGLWPWLFVGRPLILSHHGVYVGWPGILKRLVTRAARNISVSRYVAKHLPVASTVIANPYRDDVFRAVDGIERERDVACVSRLVSDKGVDVLLQALAKLADRGLRPTVTIVGDGPELPGLKSEAAALGLAEQVVFKGVRSGRELASTLNAHKLLVIPSRWEEPFGIVALEGIACGCTVVGTDGGGLPEAVGPCGVVIPRNDPDKLAQAIEALLRDPDRRAALQAMRPAHLRKHSQMKVIDAYLDVLFKTVRRKRNAAPNTLASTAAGCPPDGICD
jgi:glycogen synthase